MKVGTIIMIQKFYMSYNKENTRPYPMSWPWREYNCILTCEVSIKPLHTIPTVAKKAVDGAEEGLHQSNYPHQGSWKANHYICPGKKTGCSWEQFKDLLKLYRESSTSEAFHRLLKERGINSKPLLQKLEKVLRHSR